MLTQIFELQFFFFYVTINFDVLPNKFSSVAEMRFHKV